MARPKKQTVDYFPHHCNHKKTMYILEQRYGNDGYAFWFKLLEMLADTKGHYIDFNDDTSWEFLQAKTHKDGGFCKEILDLIAKLDAIDPELWGVKVVWSQNFVDGISDAYKNRRVELPQRPSFYIQKPRQDLVSTYINPQTKLKETKVNNNIYGEFKNVLLSDDDYKKLIDKFGEKGTKERIEDLSKGIASKGYKYKNHYATILNWDRRKEAQVDKPNPRAIPKQYTNPEDL